MASIYWEFNMQQSFFISASYKISINSHINLKREVVLFPFYRWGHWWIWAKYLEITFHSGTAQKRNDLLIYLSGIRHKEKWHLSARLALLPMNKDFVFTVDFLLLTFFFMIDIQCIKFCPLYLMIAMCMPWTFSLRKTRAWWWSPWDNSFSCEGEKKRGSLSYLNWIECNAKKANVINWFNGLAETWPFSWEN